MGKLKNTSGFAVLEGLLIAVIVAIVGFAGYKVYQARNSTNKLNEQSASQAVAVSKSAAPTTGVPSSIKSASDLDKAARALDKDNPDDNSSDISQIDTQASTF